MRKYKKVKRKEIIFNLDEWQKIEQQAAAVSLKTGVYIRRMALDGQVNCYNAEKVAPLLNALRIIGNNINQLAKKANEINSIYAKDYNKMKAEYEDLCLILPKTHTYKTNINHISPCKKIKVLRNSRNTLIDILCFLLLKLHTLSLILVHYNYASFPKIANKANTHKPTFPLRNKCSCYSFYYDSYIFYSIYIVSFLDEQPKYLT